MNTITKEQAKALFDSGFWESLTHRERAEFQLHEPRLCMPFGVFQEAVERVLGRGVQTIEFANPEHLRREMRGNKPAPTLDEILALIPEEKRVVIFAGKDAP